MPWTPDQHWLFPGFRLAWSAGRGRPAEAGHAERCVCNLRIAWANPDGQAARYEARFSGPDGQPLEALRFGGVLAPRAAASFDLLGHPALAAECEQAARGAGRLERHGWFELMAGPGVRVSVWQDWLDERPAAGALCRWSQELRADALPAAGAPIEPCEGPAPPLWRAFDDFLRPLAAPPRARPGDALAAERRLDPRCGVIRRDIELLEREFESLREELEHTPAARREAVRLLIDAVQSEQRALAAEARAYGCPQIEAALAAPASLAARPAVAPR